MSEFTLEELLAIMRESAGVDEDIDLSGDVADTEFADLGYDSLAVLELAGQVQRRYGISIPDEASAEMPTPRAVVELVNRHFAEIGV
jgi:act minimal PKS acyl carrier protein